MDGFGIGTLDAARVGAATMRRAEHYGIGLNGLSLRQYRQK